MVLSQASKLNSKRWSRLLKGHITAEWQNQDLNSNESDFKAVPFLLLDTVEMKINQDSKGLLLLSF